jgi:hypothetical protein
MSTSDFGPSGTGRAAESRRDKRQRLQHDAPEALLENLRSSGGRI